MLHRIGQATLLAAVLCGCSSLSETECQSANWKEIGYEDGARGARPARADDHTKACSKHGVAFDREAWQRGYARGLEQYCTPQNAVRIGLRGADYGGVCPPEADLQFSSHWRAGRLVWEQRRRVAELQERRRELEYAYGAANSDQDRYNVRVQLARVDDQLRYESVRLRDEEARLAEFVRGLP
jgi:hypothetical protein